MLESASSSARREDPDPTQSCHSRRFDGLPLCSGRVAIRNSVGPGPQIGCGSCYAPTPDLGGSLSPNGNGNELLFGMRTE
jgi:hypothetical protein